MRKVAPFIIICTVFAVFWAFFQDFRHSDPDQYFHLAVARYQAATGNFTQLPQVKGMGWDKQFVDKEWLYHQFLQFAYRVGGESAVWGLAFVFCLLMLVSLYFLTYTLTKNKYLSLLAALTPLLSDTFVLKLMVLRAYVPAIALFFGLLTCLIRRQKWGVFLAALFFMQFYHAFYIPLSALLIMALMQKETRKLVLWGVMGLILGGVLNPAFPENIKLILLPFAIVTEQFKATGLPFGPEQEPFRSDHLVLVFRFCFLFFIFAMSTWCLLWRGSERVRRADSAFEKQYVFISLLTAVYFLGLLISPRRQEYLVPLMSVFFVCTLVFWKNTLQVLGFLGGTIIFIMVIARPYQGFSQQMQGFKDFNNAHFEILKSVPPRPLFNCEWWGGTTQCMPLPSFRFWMFLILLFYKVQINNSGP